MNSYLYAIKTAVFIFPVIAVIITIPYILYNYHKYGAVSIVRTLIIYSFILYMINAFFLVILPLPSITYVENLKTARYQLIPFQFITDIASTIKIYDISSFIAMFKKHVVLQVVYNVVMTIPFGIYMRYYFNSRLRDTMLISFLLSLFFETTQLTGLFWIYPRGYRLFDIDDLFLNTLGGVIGYAITPVIELFLPSREKIDEFSYHKGEKVGLVRRTLAFLIDLCIAGGTLIVLDKTDILTYLTIVLLYYVIVSILLKGQTIGKKIVSIKVCDIYGNTQWYQYFIRYITLYLIFLPMPYYLNLLLDGLGKLDEYNQIILLLEIIFLALIWIIFIYKACVSFFDSDRAMLHERISRTEGISSIEYGLNENENEIDNV